MKNYKNLFLLFVLLTIVNCNVVHGEDENVDSGTCVITIADGIGYCRSPIYGENGNEPDADLGIEEAFEVGFCAWIDDPSIHAEIMDGTCKWTIKAVIVERWNEETQKYDTKKYENSTDLEKSPDTPLFLEPKIGEKILSSHPYWKFKNNGKNDGSWFAVHGQWWISFDIEIKGTRKDNNGFVQMRRNEPRFLPTKPIKPLGKY
ncbi:MAG: hypothetical protein LBB88_01530 [Planctomycetaceae bacterium]|jgi:hypothetical protein|nr:hypothetical protein [Planctomycetaceae bacterium]